jgi:hypothetical protein
LLSLPYWTLLGRNWRWSKPSEITGDVLTSSDFGSASSLLYFYLARGSCCHVARSPWAHCAHLEPRRVGKPGISGDANIAESRTSVFPDHRFADAPATMLEQQCLQFLAYLPKLLMGLEGWILHSRGGNVLLCNMFVCSVSTALRKLSPGFQSFARHVRPA